jgi:hypothetical protein
LLPSNCTDQERAAIVLQGFHGLQLYANQFWYRHVLACCGLYAKGHIILPNELSNQLKKLLRFRKQARHEAFWSGNSEAGSNILHENGDGDFLALNQLPRDVRDFIWEVIKFRKGVSSDDFTQKTPDGMLDSNARA